MANRKTLRPLNVTNPYLLLDQTLDETEWLRQIRSDVHDAYDDLCSDFVVIRWFTTVATTRLLQMPLFRVISGDFEKVGT